ncbi:MAG: ABC transporter ATP-binding protein [Deltaproteobacteria bacterium]|nr:ABC transporter ATP-binding protein [Deltaproteobacteria bacterium]
MTGLKVVFEEVNVFSGLDSVQILRNVNFSISNGEKICLMGLNGSGKTTVLSTMAGLWKYDGKIEIGSLPLTIGNLKKIRESIGYLFNVPEDQLLFTSVEEDVALSLMKKSMSEKEIHLKVSEILSLLGISNLNAADIHELSHGQKQKVALAGAMICKPPLLCLDEPSSALDPVSKRKLIDMLSENNNSTIICATNDIEFADGFASRKILMENGSVLSDDISTMELKKHWKLD